MRIAPVLLVPSLLLLVAACSGGSGDDAGSDAVADQGTSSDRAVAGDAPSDPPSDRLADLVADSAPEALKHDFGELAPADLADAAAGTDPGGPEGQVSDLAAEAAADAEGDTSDVLPWRSALFPEDWTPAFTDEQGRFLHDFSYAGYHNSLDPLPDTSGIPSFSVLDFGADPLAAGDSTPAFQDAITAASVAGGGVVFVPEGLYRCDGTLAVKQSGVVIRGQGPELSRVFFSKTEGMEGANHITFSGALSASLQVPLAKDGQNRAPYVEVDDASGFAPGDDVSIGWVISDAFVEAHGMTGTWKAFNGTWRPFFRRQVEAVDLSVVPNVVVLDVPLRYPGLVSDQASLRKETGYLSEVGIEDIGLANAVDWDTAWTVERLHLVMFSGVKDGWMRNVHSFVSPLAPESGDGAGAHLQNSGLAVQESKRITVADCSMQKAQNRGEGGAGYLFEILTSSEVLTRDCVAAEGRHNFIQNWGFGTTGCVWFQCTSSGGFAIPVKELPMIGTTGYSEYHHSLATANLVDSCTFADGFKAVNRHDWSSGAGHTATQDVFWNTQGSGQLFSRQFGWGYVIGTEEALSTFTALTGLGGSEGEGTAPEDYVEGLGAGKALVPQSLFEEQLLLRTSK
jgi:hypothetical protein